ncbi:hypothetical protein SDRG_11130 [Saprolegnia diclina VS20]|uniref:AB hydrolase-1 domain-containing protein n=1 Tax=Saprolegnia diclina (strain VS20) TaxID=1156394 RepID=T0RMM0_SAPDV|nr:hypothetical protein SDRG_11130 [Saprolegnia diclina VS20]EQC31207.1 hypothetical protein SDRG_11130 [Saprolegnia diclina VS20]|eukprot:XP_008615380.1 hypothetical protein SDRG_11130 [Saprolegnia diclina VS20]
MALLGRRSRALVAHARHLVSAPSLMEHVQLMNGHSVSFHRSTPRDVPASTPTLVFFHGLGASHQTFKYIGAMLGQRYPIIAFDMPGTGQSSAAAAGPDYNAHAVDAALDEAIEALCGPTTPRVYVGHSLGGHAALRITASHLRKYEPGVVRGLGLLATAALEPYHVMQPFVSLPPCVSSWVPTAVVAKVFHAIGFSHQHQDSDYKHGLMRLVTTDWRVLRDAASTIAAYELPCLGIAASDDQFLLFPRWRALCAAVGSPDNVRVLSYPSGKHNIPKSRAADVAHDLQQWLATCGVDDASPQTV